ncbi:hypothetical protein BH09VER1_BH09VER1_06400 [soil metagenome]
MNKSFLTLVLVAASLSTAPAHKVEDLKLHPTEGTGVTIVEDGETITIKANGGPAQIRLAELDKPGLRTRIYGVTGEVKYSQVAGDGYLEMWSVFPSGRYFSRTLGEVGPMAKLTGDSDWRTFLLPFDKMGNQEVPGTLELNLVLPRGGEVSFRNLVLKEFTVAVSLNDLMEEEGARWADRRVFWIEGLATVLIVLVLALGVFSLMGRPHAAWVCSVMLSGFGLLFMAAGFAALGKHQPVNVSYPLLLAGAGTVTVFGLVSACLRKWDLRKQAERIAKQG